MRGKRLEVIFWYLLLNNSCRSPATNGLNINLVVHTLTETSFIIITNSSTTNIKEVAKSV